MNKLPALAEKVLTDFIAQLTHAYPNLIEGFYLTGSIPLGDYHDQKSDIDFLAFLKENPDIDTLSSIERIHLAIEKEYNNPKLNGYYLTHKGIAENQLHFPSFFEGTMHVNRPFELDKVTLFELQTISIPVLGKPAPEIPIQISIDEVVTQLHQNINSYWTRWIDKHRPFTPGYLYLTLFPQLTEWGILGVARQLYTLETAKITSKRDAGLYCLEKLPDSYHDIITTAIETRKINKTQVRPSIQRANKTLACMTFIIATFNQTYNERKPGTP